MRLEYWIEKDGVMVNNLVDFIGKNCEGEYGIDVMDYPHYIQLQTEIDDVRFFSQHTDKEFKKLAKQYNLF